MKKFLSGLKADLPKSAYVMTYKKIDSKAGWPRVDVLIHAASYYGIFNGCVDIGNYETGLDYFPIHFKDTIPLLGFHFWIRLDIKRILSNGLIIHIFNIF